jgi:hypothetical protein
MIESRKGDSPLSTKVFPFGPMSIRASIHGFFVHRIYSRNFINPHFTLSFFLNSACFFFKREKEYSSEPQPGIPGKILRPSALKRSLSLIGTCGLGQIYAGLV